MPETTPNFTASLTASDLAVAREGRVIVDGVNLTLAPGEAVILRGPNGSGKTTLLRALAGLLSPAGGAVTVSEEDARIYCGTLNAAKPVMTVNESLRFWASQYGAADIETARAAFGLDMFAMHPMRTLSTGYRRRLGLARLLISGRPIWLVDEPVSGLDAASTENFERLLSAHRARGGAAIIASHEPIKAPGARQLELVA